ncbi:MAG: hypothetical protein ABR956_07705 [Terracidiphilus sp.]
MTLFGHTSSHEFLIGKIVEGWFGSEPNPAHGKVLTAQPAAAFAGHICGH